MLPGRHVLNLLALIAAIGCTVWFALAPQFPFGLIALLAIALLGFALAGTWLPRSAAGGTCRWWCRC